MLNFNEYINQDPYPHRPKKPSSPKEITSKSMAEYALELEKYEEEMEDYKIKQEMWRTEDDRLTRKFRDDLLEDYGLTNHPKADKLFAFAWEHGHSGGYGNVDYWMSEIYELIKED